MRPPLLRSFPFRTGPTSVLAFAVIVLLSTTAIANCSTWKRMRGTADSETTDTSPAPATAAETRRLKGAEKKDGIVRLSGLRFQQCTAGQDSTLRVCTGDAVSMNHFRADDYCRRLTLGNQRWRLPTRSELESILLAEQDFAPLTDPDVVPGTRPMMYWTGDSFHGANSAFWTVDFLDGRTRGEEIFKNAYVRCVSG